MDGYPVPHPIRGVTAVQGRTLTWLAKQLGISANYLHRLLLPAGHPDARVPPSDFYPRVAALLGVPEDTLYPPWQENPAA